MSEQPGGLDNSSGADVDDDEHQGDAEARDEAKADSATGGPDGVDRGVADSGRAPRVPPGEVPRTTTTGDPEADFRTSPDSGATKHAERGDDLDDADQVHDDGRHLQRPDPDRPDPGEGRPR